MKNIFKTISALLLGAALLFGAVGCSNGLGDGINDSANGARAATVTLNPSVTITINLFGVPSDNTTPGVWAWTDGASGYYVGTSPYWSSTLPTWPGSMTMTSTTVSGYSAYTYSLHVDSNYDLGILFNKIPGGSPQTKDIIIPKSVFTSDVTLYFNWSSMAYYTSIDDCIGILSGSITALDTSSKTATIKVTTSLLDSIDITKLSVKDSAGNALALDSSETTISISSNSATIKVKNGTGDVAKTPYKITYNEKDTIVAVSVSLIESVYGANAAKSTDPLGLTLSGTTATFRTWAPTATSVNLLLYADSTTIGNFKAATVAAKASGSCDETELKGTPAKTEAMTSDSTTGVWSATISDANSYKYYKYEIENNGTKYYVSDIWHTVAGPDSVASQIATIDDTDATPTGWEANYTNPFGSTGTETKKYNDAVIYEMHIRDWSRAFVSNSTGKFLDIANNLGSSGEFAKHLKDLGVTHVQILPMFDYAQVNSDKNYNWGYNPYHYNVPEGRYVTDGYTDGTQAVKEMRRMIQAFHEAGIAVIMDVVYNHTSSTGGGSLYDSTVPGYFYRQDSSGNYSNGSGVGNDTASDRAMVHKYFLESIVHWVKDYHINGFRFDLMGVHDTDFMRDVYDTLYKIDKNILVYGEPWTGGTIGTMTSEKKQALGAGTTANGYGYGAFEDGFRDAVKGVDSFGFGLGQVQGTYADENIVKGLKGDEIVADTEHTLIRNETGNPGLALHYAECHDNYTLFDKLVYSTIVADGGSVDKDKDAPKFAAAYKSVTSDSSKLDLIKKEDKLAAAYVILSQGTPFINGGQEFLRTKKGDPDSYAADTKGGITWTNTAGDYNIDDVNTIDLNMKTTYSDVYNVYKGLIALRKDYSAFRGYGSADAEKLADGVTKYTVSASDGNFTVLFNATDSTYLIVNIDGSYFGLGFGDVDVGINGNVVTISESDGSVSIADSASDVANVPAKSFVIVKTN